MKEHVRKILKRQNLSPGEDGLYYMLGTKLLFSPWVFSSNMEQIVERDCEFNHQFLFNHVLESKSIPLRCMDCWKVVAIPRNLIGLRAVYSIQQRGKWLAKCGLEGDRPNSDRLYGAYWYCDSREEGRKRKEQVKELVHLNFDLGPDVDVYLKRGCTEFEQALGRSDEWKVEANQEKLEKAASKLFKRTDPELFIQTPAEKSLMVNEWNRHAYRWGDKSYLQFTGGEPMFSACVTY